MPSPLRSKYVNIKVNLSETGIDPLSVVDFITDPSEDQQDKFAWSGSPGASVLWAVHDEPGKKLHCHMVVRFPCQTSWTSLREYLSRIDPHHYSQPARAYQRSVRYLLHLDNPEKTPISRENLKTKNVDDSELSMLLGAPRTCILEDIKHLPADETFRAFDWLCNEKGHSPNEVTQVLRCLTQISEWVKRVKEDSGLRASVESLPFSDFGDESEFSEPSPFEGEFSEGAF